MKRQPPLQVSSMMFERFDVEKIRGMGWKPCPRWVFYQKKEPTKPPTFRYGLVGEMDSNNGPLICSDEPLQEFR